MYIIQTGAKAAKLCTFKIKKSNTWLPCGIEALAKRVDKMLNMNKFWHETLKPATHLAVLELRNISAKILQKASRYIRLLEVCYTSLLESCKFLVAR